MSDFNDYFEKSNGKKVLPGNEKDPKKGGKHAARVSTVRGGKAGGVERDGGKPHKTSIDVKKSFPVVDDTSFRIVNYVRENEAPQQAEETEQE